MARLRAEWQVVMKRVVNLRCFINVMEFSDSQLLNHDSPAGR